MLQHKRIIPSTNIAELVEYVLPPHSDDVTKPCALNTFLNGLTELGVDKVVSDLIEKENRYRNNKNTPENESNVESLSDREEEGKEIDSANGSQAEATQESDNDTENDSQEIYSIFTDVFAPKWARGPHNLARFPSWDPCITPGY